MIPCPSFCKGTDRATVVAWEIAPGEAFERHQVLVVLETAKCAWEHTLATGGVLLEQLAFPGFEVGYGEPLMRVRLVPE